MFRLWKLSRAFFNGDFKERRFLILSTVQQDRSLDSAQEISRIFGSNPDLLAHLIKVFLTVGKIVDVLPDNALTSCEVKDLLTAALLHDIGKSTWEKDWFVKPRHLISEDDWEQMQKHPLEGARILSSFPDIPESIIRLVAAHHERPRGGGYPQQKKPDFLSMILAAADVYSACTEDRAYRTKRLNLYEVCEQLKAFVPTVIIEALLK